MKHVLTAEKVAVAIAQNKGNLAAVGRQYGVSRQSVWEFVQRHPTCTSIYAEQRESMIDNAESVLYSKVLAGETAELLFFLRTQGKHRGYTERHEHTGPEGAPIPIAAIIIEDAPRDDGD